MLVPLIFFIKRVLFPSPKEGPPQPWRPSHHPAPKPKRDLQRTLLYEQFLREFNAEERRYFSRLARECLQERNYPRGEELYQYCYFSTLKFRLERLWKGQRKPSCLGVYVYTQSIKELEHSIGYYQNLLEKGAFSPPGGDSPSSWLEEKMKELSLPRKTLTEPPEHSLQSLDKGGEKGKLLSKPTGP